ncbi:MAG: hypothetical protein OXC94_09840 [Chloroflexi bacterium]|nr:hypothetical protein [Chloroflexota bacterium]
MPHAYEPAVDAAVRSPRIVEVENLQYTSEPGVVGFFVTYPARGDGEPTARPAGRREPHA